MYLKNNLEKVHLQIREAASRAGRSEEAVTLVAVSKTVDAETIRRMSAQGQINFAENRAQVLRDKARVLADLDIKWHFIGPLQSNKIKYVYPVASLIHSIDRVELLEEFERWHLKTGRKCPILLEVHISDEQSKQGFACEEILDVITRFRSSEHLDIRGLMGMAPFVDDEQTVRECFSRLAQLLERSKSLEGPAYRAEELSMGMSGDFAIAVAEGATLVRIGTALFAGE